jgi:hypothetical protein
VGELHKTPISAHKVPSENDLGCKGVKSKNRVAQENELLCKIIAYNITVLIHEMFESGYIPEFAESVPGMLPNQI